MNSNEVTARLENWWYDSLNHVMWGNVYDDIRQRWWEGAHIHTSNLRHKKGTEFKEGMIINTLNSNYLLGHPSGYMEDEVYET